MGWILDLWRGLCGWCRDVEDVFDITFPEPPDCEPAIPDDDLWCPDTQPTAPGALDTLPGPLT